MSMSAEEVFAFTQERRKALVEHYMSPQASSVVAGELQPARYAIPEKTAEQRIILEALDGMDHAEIEKLKIITDNKALDQADAVLAFMAEVTQRVKGNIYEHDGQVGEIPDVAQPLISGEELVPGVLSRGSDQSLDYHSFMEQQKAG